MPFLRISNSLYSSTVNYSIYFLIRKHEKLYTNSNFFFQVLNIENLGSASHRLPGPRWNFMKNQIKLKETIGYPRGQITSVHLPEHARLLTIGFELLCPPLQWMEYFKFQLRPFVIPLSLSLLSLSLSLQFEDPSLLGSAMRLESIE